MFRKMEHGEDIIYGVDLLLKLLDPCNNISGNKAFLEECIGRMYWILKKTLWKFFCAFTELPLSIYMDSDSEIPYLDMYMMHFFTCSNIIFF